MPWWLWILLAAAAVVLLLYFSPIQVHVTYSRIHEDDKLHVKLKLLYGLYRFQYAIPLIRFRGLWDGLTVKTDMDNNLQHAADPNPVKHFTKDDIVTFFHKMKEAVHHTLGVVDWFKETMALVHCTQLNWTTYIGIGDAADTAITTGLIWGIKSSTLGYLFQFLHLDTKARINVIPMYNQAHFSTEISYTAKIRLGHAVIAGLHLLVRVLRVKGGIKAWQSMLFKAKGAV